MEEGEYDLAESPGIKIAPPPDNTDSDGSTMSEHSDEGSMVSENDQDGRETEETDYERALKVHMANFPERFTEIPSHRRVQWAKDNLNDEWEKHEANRRVFEADRDQWYAEKAAIEAANLLQIQKEIVRIWMRAEDNQWARARESWIAEKARLEQELKMELARLRKMVMHDGSINYNAVRTVPYPTHSFYDNPYR